MVCCSYCILVLFRYCFWWPIWNSTGQHKLAWQIDWPMHIPYIVAMQYFFCSLIVTIAYQRTNFPHCALFLLSIQMLIKVLCTIKSFITVSCLLLVANLWIMMYDWFGIVWHTPNFLVIFCVSLIPLFSYGPVWMQYLWFWQHWFWWFHDPEHYWDQNQAWWLGNYLKTGWEHMGYLAARRWHSSPGIWKANCF